MQLDKKLVYLSKSKVLVRCLSPRPIPLHTGANIGFRKTSNQKYRISKFANLQMFHMEGGHTELLIQL
jgi:hypothetical protein